MGVFCPFVKWPFIILITFFMGDKMKQTNKMEKTKKNKISFVLKTIVVLSIIVNAAKLNFGGNKVGIL